jgi:uncharacterized protein (TIGR04141 family)
MTNTRTVSVYLLRQSVGGAEDALTVDLGDLDEYRVPAIGDQARLYVNRSLPKTPAWASLFDGATEPSLELSRPSFSAILFVAASDRLFALTFGGGKPGRSSDTRPRQEQLF